MIPIEEASDSSISFLGNEAFSVTLPQNLQYLLSAQPDVRRTVLYFYEEKTASLYNIKFSLGLTAMPPQKIYGGVSRGQVRTAVDYIASNLYWTEPSFKTVKMMSTAGDVLKSFTLIAQGIGLPLGLAVDPVNGQVTFLSHLYQN